MDRLTQLSELLKNQPSQPPIEQWHPELSGDIDIIIKANGDWFHEGSKIERKALVQLFFSILRCENDGQYYLVTPVEKWRLRVEQAACIAVDMDVLQQGSEQQQIVFTTDTGVKVLLSQAHSLAIESDTTTSEPVPLLSLRHGLTAKLSRAVFYRLVDVAEEQHAELRVLSDNYWFSLGAL